MLNQTLHCNVGDLCFQNAVLPADVVKRFGNANPKHHASLCKDSVNILGSALGYDMAILWSHHLSPAAARQFTSSDHSRGGCGAPDKGAAGGAGATWCPSRPGSSATAASPSSATGSSATPPPATSSAPPPGAPESPPPIQAPHPPPGTGWVQVARGAQDFEAAKLTPTTGWDAGRFPFFDGAACTWR